MLPNGSATFLIKCTLTCATTVGWLVYFISRFGAIASSIQNFAHANFGRAKGSASNCNALNQTMFQSLEPRTPAHLSCQCSGSDIIVTSVLEAGPGRTITSMHCVLKDHWLMVSRTITLYASPDGPRDKVGVALRRALSRPLLLVLGSMLVSPSLSCAEVTAVTSSATLGSGDTTQDGGLTLVVLQSTDGRHVLLKNNDARTIVVDAYSLSGGGSHGCNGNAVTIETNVTRRICSLPGQQDVNSGQASLQLYIRWHEKHEGFRTRPSAPPRDGAPS
jgi:hypothetical protein